VNDWSIFLDGIETNFVRFTADIVKEVQSEQV
jgi:hypothetical protein